MLATCLAILALSLHAGEVVMIPADTPLVVPGKLNWVLRHPTFMLSGNTQAIVIRTSPENLGDVVEVKVFDGTSRLGWLEAAGLRAIQPVITGIGVTSPKMAENSSRPTKSYGVEVDPRRGHRRGHLPDFSAVDAMLATGIQEAQSSSGSGFSGSSSRSTGSHLCNKPNRSRPGLCQRRVADGGACPEHG